MEGEDDMLSDSSDGVFWKMQSWETMKISVVARAEMEVGWKG